MQGQVRDAASPGTAHSCRALQLGRLWHDPVDTRRLNAMPTILRHFENLDRHMQ